MVQIGIGKKNADFNFTMIQKKELNILGSRNAFKDDFIELIELIRSGNADVGKAITDIYKFEDAVQASGQTARQSIIQSVSDECSVKRQSVV